MGKLPRYLIKQRIHIIERHFLGPYSEYGTSVVQTQGARLLKQRAQNTRKEIVSEVIVHFICACLFKFGVNVPVISNLYFWKFHFPLRFLKSM